MLSLCSHTYICIFHYYTGVSSPWLVLEFLSNGDLKSFLKVSVHVVLIDCGLLVVTVV